MSKEKIKCPDCKSDKIIKLDGIRRHCQKCGRVFNLNQIKLPERGSAADVSPALDAR